MDRRAWQAIVHGVTKSQTWLSKQTAAKPLFLVLDNRADLGDQQLKQVNGGSVVHPEMSSVSLQRL